MVTDARTALEDFQDHLAPMLDVYEQAVYLYLLRHSHLAGRPKITVEFKTARKMIASGLGARGGPLAEKTCLGKLRSLKAKGCVATMTAREGGTEILLRLPTEVPGIHRDGVSDPGPSPTKPANIEQKDFLRVARNRRLIFAREGGRCFYCLKKLSESGFVIDRVQARPGGDHSYRNVVASCRRCSTRKGESSAESLLRVIYREGCIGADELVHRLRAVEHLRTGRLRP